MVNMGTALAYLELDTSRFTSSLFSALANLNVFADEAASVGDKISALGATVTGVGKTLTTSLTLPIVGLGSAAFKLSSDFETAMSKVATIADTNKKSLSDLESEIKNLSNNTGVAVSDLAEATYNAISASVDTASAVDFVADANKLAVGGFTDVTTAVDALTTVINAYGLEASDAAHISDVLISTQNKGKTTVDELAQSIGKVIPTANSFGVSIEELGTAYSYLTANGIATAESTTYMNGMFNELGKSGTKVSEALKGSTGKTFKELMESGSSLSEVMDILNKYAEQNAISFGDLWSSQEAVKAAQTILKTNTEEYNATLKDFQTTIGDTDEAYNTMSDTFQYKFGVAIQNAKNALIEFGQTIGGLLAPIIENVSAIIQNITEKISNLTDKEKEQIVKIAAIAAAIGPVLLAVGGLVTNIGKLVDGFSRLGAIVKTGTGFFAGMSAPVLAVVSAIAALTTALVYLYNTNDEFKENIGKLVERFKEVGGYIWETLKPAFESLRTSFMHLWEDLQPLVEMLGDVLVSALNTVLGLIEKLTPALEPLIGFIGSVVETIGGIIGAITAIFTGDKEAFRAAVEHIGNGVKEIFSNTIESIKELFRGLIDWINIDWGTAIKDGFSNALSTAVDAVSAVKDGFGNVFETAVDSASAVKDNFGNVLNIAAEAASSMKNGHSYKNTITTAIGFGEAIGGAVKRGIDSVLGGVTDYTEKKITSNLDWTTATSEGMTFAMKKQAEKYEKEAEALRKSGKTYSDAVEETGKETATAVTKEKSQIELAMTALERSYKLREMTEEEYQAARLKYLNEHWDAESDEFAKYYGQVMGYYDKLADEENKKAEEAAKERKTNFEKILNDYKSAMEKIKGNIQSYADKLTGAYKDFYTFQMNKNGEITKAFTTDKMIQEQKALDKYINQLEKFEKRGVGKNMISQLAGMSQEEAVNVLEYWNKLSDKQIKNLEGNYKAVQEKSAKIGEMVYQSETETATNDIAKAMSKYLDESNTFRDIGLQMLAGIIDGLTEGMGEGSKFRKTLDDLYNSFKSSPSLQIDGSHYSGLSYVPYDGYIAELHKGERVLTASESRGYSSPTNQSGLSKSDILDAVKQAITQAMPSGDVIMQADGRQIALITRKELNMIGSESGNLNLRV